MLDARMQVSSVALYGAEIWGWKNKAQLDRIKTKYTKWILRLDKNTPTMLAAFSEEN